MNFISHIFSRNAFDLEKRAAIVRYDPQGDPSFVSQGIINVYFWLKSLLVSLAFGNMIFFFFLKKDIYLFGCVRSELHHVGSFHVVHRLCSCGPWAQACGLTCPAACWILVPPPKIELMSHALQGGFVFTTGPPGKS